jgi:plastocyanin
MHRRGHGADSSGVNRSWVAAGIVAALAASGPPAGGWEAAPRPMAPVVRIVMYDDRFDPRAVRGTVGVVDVEWRNDGAVFHSVFFERAPRWFETDLDEGQSAGTPLRYAGTFAFVCTYHPGMTGVLRIAPQALQAQGPPRSRLRLKLAMADPAVDGYAFDVRWRRVGGGRWSPPERVPGATYRFRSERPGRFQVQARLVGGGRGAWSPRVQLRVTQERSNRIERLTS